MAQMRAEFTVKGANAADLVERAQRQANALAGVDYEARVESLDIAEDMRIEPLGEVTGWRADVIASLRVRPPGPDEEPF